MMKRCLIAVTGVAAMLLGVVSAAIDAVVAFIEPALALLAPERVSWRQVHPRSIFETRRAGLA